MSKRSVPATNDFCPQTLFLYGTYKEDNTPNFGLFCWFSYYWDTELGVMMCIGEDKLTRDRIRQNRIFSANLVTEQMLPLADYLGNTSGYDEGKMNFELETEEGSVLHVPTLAHSPVVFELEVAQSFRTGEGEVFLCKIRNVLMEEGLTDAKKSVEERIRGIAPIHTTCSTYFSWDGRSLGGWGSPKEAFKPAGKTS